MAPATAPKPSWSPFAPVTPTGVTDAGERTERSPVELERPLRVLLLATADRSEELATLRAALRERGIEVFPVTPLRVDRHRPKKLLRTLRRTDVTLLLAGVEYSKDFELVLEALSADRVRSGEETALCLLPKRADSLDVRQAGWLSALLRSDGACDSQDTPLPIQAVLRRLPALVRAKLGPARPPTLYVFRSAENRHHGDALRTTVQASLRNLRYVESEDATSLADGLRQHRHALDDAAAVVAVRSGDPGFDALLSQELARVDARRVVLWNLSQNELPDGLARYCHLEQGNSSSSGTRPVNSCTLDEVLDAAARERAPLVDLPSPSAALPSAEIRPSAETRPFSSTRPFTRADVHRYFGRDDDVASCLARFEVHRVLSLVGSEGSGKTSLVQAGLAGALLLHHRTHAARVPDWLELSEPVAWRTLEPLLEDRFPGQPPLLIVIDPLESWVLDSVDPSVTATGEPPRAPNDGTRPNLAERRECLERLLAMVERPELSLFLVSCSTPETFALAARQHGALLRQGVWTPSEPSRDELRRMIESPLRRLGIEPFPSFTRRILSDVASGRTSRAALLGALGHSLDRSWQQWLSRPDRGPSPTLVDYETVGGLELALDQTAEKLFSELDPRSHDAVEALFRRLIGVTRDGRVVLEEVPLSELDAETARPEATDATAANTGVASDPSPMRELVDRFSAAGLLRVLPATSPLPKPARAHVRISSVALPLQWQRLSRWVWSERRMTQAFCELWALANVPEDGPRPILLRGELLDRAVHWWRFQKPTPAWIRRCLQRVAPEIPSPSGHAALRRIADLIADSEAELRVFQDSADTRRDAEAARRRALASARASQQRSRRSRNFAFVASCMALVLAALAAWGYSQNRSLREQLHRAPVTPLNQ